MASPLYPFFDCEIFYIVAYFLPLSPAFHLLRIPASRTSPTPYSPGFPPLLSPAPLNSQDKVLDLMTRSRSDIMHIFSMVWALQWTLQSQVINSRARFFQQEMELKILLAHLDKPCSYSVAMGWARDAIGEAPSKNGCTR